MCKKLYTVGPQLYIRTVFPDIGLNSSVLPDSVLWSFMK